MGLSAGHDIQTAAMRDDRRATPATKAKKGGGDLVAARVAEALRQEILARGEGAFLGSEDDLVSRYRVSRPTFRQTARMLESEQLLKVKRGIGGGYYARGPSTQSVGDAAATYLGSRNTGPGDLLEAWASASLTIARLAAQSTDETAREALREQCERMGGLEAGAITVAQLIGEDRKLAVRLGALSGNPPLELFVAMLDQVGVEGVRTEMFVGRPDRRADYLDYRRRLCAAILAGDCEVAEVQQGRVNRQLLAWRRVDLDECGGGSIAGGWHDVVPRKVDA